LGYSLERKSAVLKRMLPPNNMAIRQLSQEEGISEAVLAPWQDMDREPTDELCGVQRHGRVSARAFAAVILDLEGDAVRIKTDQAAVRDSDPVRVARQVGQHRPRPGERLLGVDNPVDFAQRFQESVEGIPVDEVCVIALELQLPGFVRPG